MQLSKRLGFFPLIVVLVLRPPIGLAEELRGGVAEENGMKVDQGRFLAPQFEVDRLDCITQTTGFTIHWQFYPTVRLLDMVEKLDLDLIFPMGFSEERDTFLTKSEYLFLSEDNFVYADQKPDFSDKVHIRIGVKRGSPQMGAVMTQGFQNVEIGNSYEGLLKMLEARRVDTIIVPDKVIETFDPAVTQRLKTEPFYQRQVGFYVGKKWSAEKLAALNAAILKCRIATQ
jgi:hypothetical protein